MAKIDPFETHLKEYEEWFDRYPAVYESELLAIRRHFEDLPENLEGIEVGLGTGKYAIPLGVKQGVEPAKTMRDEAVKSGLEVMDARAEHLPYKDLQFDFVLFVTVCHLDDVRDALKEAHRVLKPGGSVIIGFIDKEGQLGKQYEQKRANSTFYREAWFYSVDKMKELIKEIGFKKPVFLQTLFDEIDKIQSMETPKEGTGEGSFVVVRAVK